VRAALTSSKTADTPYLRYIVRQGFIHQGEVERTLAALCLQYLTFECFDAELSTGLLQTYAGQGYFAFQEYAVAHWIHHLESFIASSISHVSTSRAEYLAELGTAVSEFVSHYEEELTADVSDEDDTPSCKQFLENSWHPCLEILLRHIRRHRRQGIEATDEISINTLRTAFFRNRNELERLAEQSDPKGEKMAIMITYYGMNWFRCSKLSCDYFHEGFPDNKRREQHINRHDRPFRCTHAGCSGSLFGFDSAKGLEKHMKNKHPPNSQVTFAKLKDSKMAVSEFKCEVCSSVFNRKFNLRTHMRTKHTTERPFRCSFEGCMSAFGRENDRRRHEALHTGDKKYICGGNVDSEAIEKWGCGLRFARLEGLGRHFRSPEGKTCLRPLWQQESEAQTNEVDRIEKVRNEAIEKWRRIAEESRKVKELEQERLNESNARVRKAAEAKRMAEEQEEKTKRRETEENATEQDDVSKPNDSEEASETDAMEPNSGSKCKLTSFDSEMLRRLPSFLESAERTTLRAPEATLDEEWDNENVPRSEAAEALGRV
jgi:hypothetical protein